jgi:hypothetical protein
VSWVILGYPGIIILGCPGFLFILGYPGIKNPGYPRITQDFAF